MSLINDALKQARQAPPRNAPTSLPPLQPHARESASAPVWLIPSIVILLVFAAIFFMGWAAAHRTVHDIVTAPSPAPVAQTVDTAPAPVVTPQPAPPAPAIPPDAPRLQGIFYSSTAPSAILDGKTVSPGDQFKEYKVKEISKYTVTLIGPDKKEFKIGMGD
jgi:hypothetical protein